MRENVKSSERVEVMACDKNPSAAMTDTKRMGSSKPAWATEVAALKKPQNKTKTSGHTKKAQLFSLSLEMKMLPW